MEPFGKQWIKITSIKEKYKRYNQKSESGAKRQDKKVELTGHRTLQ